MGRRGESVSATPYVLLAVLVALAGAVLLIGLPLRHKVRRRGQYVLGLVAISVGLVLLWVLPALVITQVRGLAHREKLELPLMLARRCLSRPAFSAAEPTP
jgi:hypothetical protein